jgi:hypothetical protein
MTDTAFWLFIDDVRSAPSSEWVVARSSSDAIAVIKQRGCPARISFDHDLGGSDTAVAVARWLVDADLDASGAYIPDDFVFSIHSANPVGAANIRGLLEGYLSYKAKNRDSTVSARSIPSRIELTRERSGC